MKAVRDRCPRRSRARLLRMEALENRHLLSASSFCGPPAPSTQDGVGVGDSVATSALLCDSQGNLWSYAASQGAGAVAQQIGSTGVSMQDLAFDGSSVFYGVDSPGPNHGSTSGLYQISFTASPPGNVQAVLKAELTSTSGDKVDLNSLAYYSGSLWAAGTQGGIGGSGNLYQIDPTTSAVTNQWPLSVASGTYAGSYVPAGDVEFFGSTGYITTASGVVLTFSPTNPGAMQGMNVPTTSGAQLTHIQGLTYGRYSANNLLLAYRQDSNDVYRLDPNLHQWVQFGSLGSSFRSLLGAAAMTASFGAAPTAEIAVSGEGDFGTALRCLPGPCRTFVVVNEGDGPLNTGTISLPEGFILTEPLDSVIPAHSQDTFTVRLCTTTAGTFGGDMVIPNDDGAGEDGIENPTVIRLDGQVIDPLHSRFVGRTRVLFQSPILHAAARAFASFMGPVASHWTGHTATSDSATQDSTSAGSLIAGRLQTVLACFDAVHARGVYW